jgi:tRNA1Val (adenine37-N6)-methyltransferase
MMNKTPELKGDDETLDTFYQGRVLVLQKKKGYRFSVDAPLLADFIQTEAPEELLELGTGNAIISLLLSIKPFRRIVALEIQDSLADLARRNVRLNRLENLVAVVQGDLRTFDPGRKFDVIFSNPPYIKNRGGQVSASEEKSIAKHELKCTIFDIMRKTAKLLKGNGRAYFIYSAKREKDFREAMEKNGLKLKTFRQVQPRRGSEANFFLAECRFSSAGVEFRAPFILYGGDGQYTGEAQKIFSGRTSD